MKSYILLEDMVFYAYHGVLPQETVVGNEFYISLRIKADLGKASISDSIKDTINYAEVFATVEKEMSHPSKLIEHVAKRIINRLKQKFPSIDEIEIKLTKRNPPISGQIGSASVIIID